MGVCTCNSHRRLFPSSFLFFFMFFNLFVSFIFLPSFLFSALCSFPLSFHGELIAL
jgi:hypothetical protein